MDLRSLHLGFVQLDFGKLGTNLAFKYLREDFVSLHPCIERIDLQHEGVDYCQHSVACYLEGALGHLIGEVHNLLLEGHPGGDSELGLLLLQLSTLEGNISVEVQSRSRVLGKGLLQSGGEDAVRHLIVPLLPVIEDLIIGFYKLDI